MQRAGVLRGDKPYRFVFSSGDERPNCEEALAGQTGDDRVAKGLPECSRTSLG